MNNVHRTVILILVFHRHKLVLTILNLNLRVHVIVLHCEVMKLCSFYMVQFSRDLLTPRENLSFPSSGSRRQQRNKSTIKEEKAARYC
jgi:hypothetical protein